MRFVPLVLVHLVFLGAGRRVGLSGHTNSNLLGTPDAITEGSGVVVDSQGNVYAAGYTDAEGDSLAGQVVTGYLDAWVAKYTSSGVLQWLKLLGVASSRTEAHGLALDSAGDVYIVGFTDGDLAGPGSGFSGTHAAFIARYSSAGVNQWVKLLGQVSVEVEAYGVAADSTDKVYMVGYTAGNMDGQVVSGSNDAFMTQYNTAGTRQWTRLFGFSATNLPETWAMNVAVVNVGMASHVYMVGVTKDPPGAFTEQYAAFTAVYSSAGVLGHSHLLGQCGDGKEMQASSVTVDSSGSIYVVGETQCPLNGQAVIGAQDAFIAKYINTGHYTGADFLQLQWTKQHGEPSTIVLARDVAVDNAGSVYMVGKASGDLGGQAQSTGETDLFLSQITDAGVIEWTELLGVPDSAGPPSRRRSTGAWGWGVAVTEDSVWTVGAASASSTPPPPSESLEGQALIGWRDTFLSRWQLEVPSAAPTVSPTVSPTISPTTPPTGFSERSAPSAPLMSFVQNSTVATAASVLLLTASSSAVASASSGGSMSALDDITTIVETMQSMYTSRI